MGLEKDLMYAINDVTDDIKIRQRREIQETLEKELFDVDFKLQYDKNINSIFIVCCLLALILFLKSVGKPLLKLLIYGEALELNVLHFICLFLVGIVVVFSIAGLIYLKNKPLPEIKGTMMYFRKNAYHYSQITEIKISKVFLATVYIDGKKRFRISRDFMNYDAFIEWAKKCNVPIEQKHMVNNEITEEQATMITAIIVVVIVIIVGVLFATGVLK